MPSRSAAQRSADSRDAKFRTKLQKLSITSKSNGLFGARNETTVVAGERSLMPRGVTVIAMGSPVTGSFDSTRAGRPITGTIRNGSSAHQAYIGLLFSAWKR